MGDRVTGARLGVIVHHTDGEREWAYDRGAPVGALSRALDEAPRHGCVVVDMQRNWRVIFSFEDSVEQGSIEPSRTLRPR
jgi:hypothetical protein